MVLRDLVWKIVALLGWCDVWVWEKLDFILLCRGNCGNELSVPKVGSLRLKETVRK